MQYLFNNARNCLRIFLRYTGVKTLWVPFELCNVVFKAARAENVQLKFYHINNVFEPICDFNTSDFILYPNYFGICDDIANKLSANYPNMIYDSAHSFFSKPLGIATIYSARKFFPVADGGILQTNLNLNPNFTRENDTEDFSTDPFNFDYENFLKNELKFNRSNEIRLISTKSEYQLKQINFKKEILQRKQHFAELHKILEPINELKIPQNIIAPMVYPLKSRDTKILKYFEQSGIFILKYDYLDGIIPLPLEMAGNLPAIKDYLQI